MTDNACSICADGIMEKPAVIAIPLPDGGEQTVWAHVSCIVSVLHPSVPTTVDETDSDTLHLSTAYNAMYEFLLKNWEVTKSDTLGSLLGSMSTLPDGQPADLAIAGEWMEAVQRARQGQVDSRLKLK